MAKSRQPIDPEKEARILQAAMHEFAAHGYRDATTDAIAEKADVSKGLVFHYFGSKANLYLQTVSATFARINQAADLTVWQDSPDLKQMITRALRYKIQMQLDYPDEFALAMAAYAEAGSLPETLRPKVAKIWQQMLTDEVPTMVTPVLKRMPLRDGVDVQTVTHMILMISNAIGETSKAMIRQNPNIQIEDFDGIVDETMRYMEVLEHGFLK